MKGIGKGIIILLARRHVIFLLIFSLTPFLLKGQTEARLLSRKALPGFCVEISSKANLYHYAGSKKKSQLSSHHSVRIEKVIGSWVKVSYSPDIDQEICSATPVLLDSGFIHIDHFPDAALIARNFIPVNSRGEPLVKIFDMGEDLISHDYQVFYPDEKGDELLTIRQAKRQPMDKPEYAFLFTGQKNYPFALFYSGNTGHLLLDLPEIIFFGNRRILPWFPNSENRKMTRLIRVSNSDITIQESFKCEIPIEVKLIWEKGVLKRSFGIFLDSRQYPSNQLLRAKKPEVEQVRTLKESLTIYKDKEKKSLKNRLEPGQKIVIRLLEVDFLQSSVFLEVNSEIGWCDLDKVRSLPLLNNEIVNGCLHLPNDEDAERE